MASRSFFCGVLLSLGLATAASAGYGGSGIHPDPKCNGDIFHVSHSWSSFECADLNNPHFAQLTNGAAQWGVCDDAASGVKNCDGCYACCNGMYDQQAACICDQKFFGKETCNLYAARNQQTCKGNCITAHDGDGCTNPELRLH